jgi:hypothetical protein
MAIRFNNALIQNIWCLGNRGNQTTKAAGIPLFTYRNVSAKGPYISGGDFMKITVLPKTRLGIQSVWLAIAAFILFVIGSVIPSRTGYSGLEMVYQNPIQTVITILILALGIAAPIMALIAVIKKKERSILIFLIIPTLLTGLLSAVGVILTVFFSTRF